MITILYVHTASTIGGASYAMLNVIRSLDRNKFRPVVLLQRNGPLVEELLDMKVEVFFLRSLNTVPYNECLFTTSNIARIYRILKSFKQFRLLLQKINPRIVYLNTMMLHPYLKIVKKYNFKSIIHIREHWPETEHVFQRNYAIQNIRKYADEIIAINDYSASMVADNTHTPTIVYDWINMSRRLKIVDLHAIFEEDCSNLRVYLCTGGYDPIKGTLEVIQAFSEVIRNPDARLLILGTRPKFPRDNFIKRLLKNNNEREYCQRLDNMIMADKRIRIIPNTYFVTDFYRKAYCLLSYFKIPHANLALAENIIVGTPVIAARTEESVEYSMNENLAILFNANDFNDFKCTLRRFDSDRPKLIDRLKIDSRLVEEMFDPATNISKLTEVYHKVIHN